MREWVLASSDLPSFIDVLRRDWDVVAPQKRDELFEFRPLEDIRELRLDYPTTMIPPSRQFMPDGEVLYRFDPADPATASAPEPPRPVALFGVHTCDLEGISVLDAVYLSPPIDRAYANRRRGAFIVGLECGKPCMDESLCGDKETYRTELTYDLLLIPFGPEEFFVRGRTQRGTGVVESSALMHPATHRDRIALEEFRGEQRQRFRKKYGLSADGLQAHVRNSWDDLLWIAQSRLCINCGACNTVCPTCHCFTTQDVLPVGEGAQGERQRHWTGCQLECFAAVAGGENFRSKKAFRLRHRIFKKEAYMVDRTGRSACVGCGRCGHFCPADIRLVELYGQLAEEGAHA